MELRVDKAKLGEFSDISSEKFRVYRFPNGTEYRIDDPLRLHVSKKPTGDSHRVLDGSGTSHYVAPTQSWAIRWVAKDNEPHFVL